MLTVLVAVCGNGRASRSSRGGQRRGEQHRAWASIVGIAVAGPPCRLQIAPDKPPDRFSYGQQILAYGQQIPANGQQIPLLQPFHFS